MKLSHYSSNDLISILSIYSKKALDPNYIPKNIHDALLSRLAVLFLKQGKSFENNPALNRFLTALSEPDFIVHFQESIRSWESLEICNIFKKPESVSCEYCLRVNTESGEKTIHKVAHFEIQDTHFYFINENNPSIRMLGDEVLQRPGILFPNNPSEEDVSELMHQIDIAKKSLIQSGGVGIAANQCLNIPDPYQFTIVGVFHGNAEHVTKSQIRYPNVRFPEALIMINPRIQYQSEEMQHFKHGCLSAPGNIRGEIATPKEIHVAFETLENGKIVTIKQAFSGTDAVVLQHELNHILYGKTYIDCCIEKLDEADLNTLKEAILKEEDKRNENPDFIAEMSNPPVFYHFIDIDEQGHTHLKLDALNEAFSKSVDNAVLSGLKKQIDFALNRVKQVHFNRVNQSV